MTFNEEMKAVIGNNLINIKKFLKNKNIENSNIDNLFSRVKVVLGKEQEYLYANISKDNPFCIILSEKIKSDDRYKWLNHEMIHIISNNQDTVNDINVGGIIVLDKEKDIIVNLYRKNEDEIEYVLETPNHKTGNLITNLARICGVETVKDEKDMKIIKGIFQQVLMQIMKRYIFLDWEELKLLIFMIMEKSK